MKKVNIFAILSLLSLVAGYIIAIFVKGAESVFLVNLIAALVAFILAIAAIVYAKKIEKSKAFGIILLVISILGTLFFLVLFALTRAVKDPKNTEEVCKKVVNCERDTSDVSTCYIEEDNTKIFPIKCYTSNLNSNQFK